MIDTALQILKDIACSVFTKLSLFILFVKVPEFWEYLLDEEEGLVSRLYEDTYYNEGNEIKYMCPDLE